MLLRCQRASASSLRVNAKFNSLRHLKLLFISWEYMWRCSLRWRVWQCNCVYETQFPEVSTECKLSVRQYLL